MAIKMLKFGYCQKTNLRKVLGERMRERKQLGSNKGDMQKRYLKNYKEEEGSPHR